MERWLLPEGVEEALPPGTWRLEAARRNLLDLFRSWGYELIRPPLIEFLESLLTGTGRDLDLRTFKLTDQLSGRLMGVRSDMTTQAARIDAHRLRREAPARYCYLGSVLHTRPDSPGGTRTPLQIGVELFGYDGVAADVEVVAVMLATLEACGINDTHVDLGHVGIYRALAARAELNEQDEWTLFDILQRKALPDLRAFIASRSIPQDTAAMLCALPELNGDISVLADARELLSAAGSEVLSALDTLTELSAQIQVKYPAVPLHIDLAELRGYQYKTGVVFAAFQQGQGRELARGGRYNNIGRAFGRGRAATGFSADLNRLAELGVFQESATDTAVFVPDSADPQLQLKVAALRRDGRQLIQQLPGQTGGAEQMACGEQLTEVGGDWVLQAVNASK